MANHKGGVGKTSSVSAIGAALANKGYRTLLVDLDAQANLTLSLIGPGYRERTLYSAIKERKALPVVSIRQGLSLTPSSLELAGVELEMASTARREFVLKDLLLPVLPDFDVILLDCPPSMGLLSVNAFAASTDLLVPLTAEALPFQGVNMIQDIMTMAKESLNPALSLSGIFFCRWEGRNLNKMVEEAIRGAYGDKVLSTRIRANVAVAEAPLSRTDIYAYSKNSNGARDYMKLTEELIQKLGI